MKILLVDPPRKFWKIFLFHTASNGLASIAGYLRSKGHDVAIADLYGLDSSWKELEDRIMEVKPDVVGISCGVVASSYDAIYCAMLAKMIDPDIVTVGGGFMFSAIPGDFLKTGYFDYAVIGEGEIAFGELLDSLSSKSDLNKVKGIAYLEEDRVKETPVMPLVEDLNALPMPAWDLFPMDRYTIRPMGGNVAFALTNSRGCVNKCTFCSEAFLWRSHYRSFSAQWTCENLEYLIKDYHKTVYIFGDNDFLYDRERLIKFCDEMERRKIRAYFWIEAGVNSILRNRDLLPRLRRVGGFNIQVGLETIDPTVLKTYRKPQNLEKMEKALKVVRDSGLSITGLFIWGDWNDTLESLKAGVKFINEKCDFIAPSIINPFPGTDYFKICEKENRIKIKNLWRYNQHHILMPLKDMDMKEAQDAYEKNAYSPSVLFNMIYQALFSPFRPARMWAWEFIKLDIRFLNPRLRKPGGQKFEDYLEQTGRKMPEWIFPYPRETKIQQDSRDETFDSKVGCY